VQGRPADGEYARFVEATIGLAAAAEGLPRRDRVGVEMAILRMWESERVGRAALASGNTRHLELASSSVHGARAMLADAASDIRRRRRLSLVA
jgi:hypothetical protein